MILTFLTRTLNGRDKLRGLYLPATQKRGPQSGTLCGQTSYVCIDGHESQISNIYQQSMLANRRDRICHVS